MDAQHRVKFENLGYRVNGHYLVRDLNAEIDGAQFVGIVGPNGAGKTTLLRLAAGFLEASEGRVLLNGRPLGDLGRREIAREISVVPQDTHLEFAFSVLDVVLMGRNPHLGRFSPISENDVGIAKEAMSQTETLEFQDRPVTDLSGGERQRVLLARALAAQSPFVILDEPTSNLDLEHTLEIMELARDLVQERGRTVLMAIHDLPLAAQYCERLLLLSQGRLVADGPPSKVLLPERIREVFHVEALGSDGNSLNYQFELPKTST